MIIDAGSTGSRMHVYEFERRVLKKESDVEAAVTGKKLSYPGSQTRWTGILRPGISSFANIEDDDELYVQVKNYLEPLIEFSKSVLLQKKQHFHEYPIYLKATAGMRTLSPYSRGRIMDVVRTLFSDKSYCPFMFEDEFARILSGEEEAIYGWAGVNFLKNTLLKNTQGIGTVVNPKHTYGALDLGGASTQISYYVHNGEIMENLFKFQVGAAKHWNCYGTSYLYYGYNEAFNRLGANIISESMVTNNRTYNNPCLPGGSSILLNSDIRIDDTNNMEKHDLQDRRNGAAFSGNMADLQRRVFLLENDNEVGDYEACSVYAKKLLHIDLNPFCEFAFDNQCSFAGRYQPPVPHSSEMEFLAFSEYYHIWDFLEMESRSNLSQLQNRSQTICNMSLKDLKDYNSIKESPFQEEDIVKYCFESAYAYQLLKNGYGFNDQDYITAVRVVNGHKVGWALGSMLYEIQALPWKLEIDIGSEDPIPALHNLMYFIFGGILVLLFSSVIASLCRETYSLSRRKKYGYTSV